MGFPRLNIDSKAGEVTYPAEFKEQLRSMFPEWRKLHECAEDGKTCVRALLANCNPRITETEVLSAKSLEELQDKAREIQKFHELVIWCDRIIRQQR